MSYFCNLLMLGMRISLNHQQLIAKRIKELAGSDAQVKLFGSRLDDKAKGGDVDLLVILSSIVEEPATLASTISAQLMRALNGRKVDVLLDAPNLETLAIHEMARKEGVLL